MALISGPLRTEAGAFTSSAPPAFFAACAIAREGHGRLVVLEGPAGSGKSAMLRALGDGLPAGFRLLHARGSELETANEFGTIERLFGHWLPGGRIGSGSLYTRLQRVQRLAESLARTNPLLIAVDDLQWVDRWSLRSLGYLANRVETAPIVLALALRPAEPGAPTDLVDAVCAPPGALRLRLVPLDAAAVAAVVRAHLPGASDELCEAFLDVTAGNPRSLRDLLDEVTTGVTIADVRARAIPHLGDRVRRRAGRIGPHADRLVRAAAVLGDGARLAEVARVAGLGEEAAADAAARLQRIDVLRRECPVEFAQPLVRRSVYAALDVAERARLEQAAGELRHVGRVQAPWAIPAGIDALLGADDLDRRAAIGLDAAAAALVGALFDARRGALLPAAAALHGLFEHAPVAPTPGEVAAVVSWLWDALGERPELDAVIARADEIEGFSLAAEPAVAAVLVAEARGRLALGRGDHDAAVQHLRDVECLRRRSASSSPESAWRIALALALRVSAPVEAAALASEELEDAARLGSARRIGVALRCSAALDRSGEVALLRRSVDVLKDSPARLELARSLVALGGALRRRSFRIEARERIREGLKLAEACGAEATARRAVDELRAAGGRVSSGPRPRTGFASLTPSELRVSRLVARGLTNDEIARELSVSLKTVETHLTHTYSKLELSGSRTRRRLAALVRDG